MSSRAVDRVEHAVAGVVALPEQGALIVPVAAERVAHAGQSAPRPAASRGARWALGLLALIITASASATVAAALRTSTTFDEVIMIAGGARGWATGAFDIQPEHPPLMLYLYGLPVHLASPNHPPHQAAPSWRTPDGRGAPRDFTFRYVYSRIFLWASGNDPVRMAFLGRLVAALCAALIVVSTYLFTVKRFGAVAAIFAAAMIAFTPDVLAHGGVAYNDIPLALGYLLALWAADSAVRRPGHWRGALFGLSFGLALAVKFSAVVIAPAALLLMFAERVGRGRDREWVRATGLAALAAIGATYFTLVLVYRGDFALAEFRYGLEYTFGHVNRGHGAPAYLLGATSTTGWWYYYPVAFLYKTPAALHLLLLAALVGFSRGERGRLRDVLASPLRMPAVGAAVFGAALFSSNLAIGFRYALPVMPLLCILVGIGVSRLWAGHGRALRGVLAALAMWHAASSLSFYPHFLAYTSEYGPGRDRGHELLLDSSLDWGQGLIEVRDWMRETGVDRIYLSYFGSGVPAGYGIEYVPLPSFFPLPPAGPEPPERPRWAVISATNLHGIYLNGDPFARLRETEPDTVLGRTMLVYRVEG